MNWPKLVVFDLDLTLWECGEAVWCDCLSPPFHLDDDNVFDRRGDQIRLFDDVAQILDELDQRQIPVAIASRTHQPGWARQLLELLDIEHRFVFQQIYPEAKLSHFASLKDESGFEFAEMMFFDDEMRNIHDVSQLGVHCVHVVEGVTHALFAESMRAYSRR